MKKMRITGICGKIRKSVTFDVPEDWEIHFRELDKKQSDANKEEYSVEGTKAMQLKVSFFNYEHKY